MEVAAIFTLLVVVATLAALALTRIAPDAILMAALGCLVISGTLTLGQAQLRV